MMNHSARIRRAFAAAIKARKNSYSPYSRFKVGAALITSRGQIISGCNVENASYGGTVCAERVAFLKAVSDGHAKFSDVIVVTDTDQPAFPCALCLQTMSEFLSADAMVYIADTKKIRSAHRFSELLPFRFGPKDLQRAKKS